MRPACLWAHGSDLRWDITQEKLLKLNQICEVIIYHQWGGVVKVSLASAWKMNLSNTHKKWFLRISKHQPWNFSFPLVWASLMIQPLTILMFKYKDEISSFFIMGNSFCLFINISSWGSIIICLFLNRDTQYIFSTLLFIYCCLLRVS